MSVVLDRPSSDAQPTSPRPNRVPLGWRAPLDFAVLGPLALLALFFGYPLVTVVIQSLSDRVGRPAGLTAWRSELASAEFGHALANTVELAVGSALLCTVLGTFFALALAFVAFRGAGVIARALTVVVAFPSFVIALSFGVLYGRTGVLSSVIGGLTGAREALGGFVYTSWAVLLAEVTFYTPFVLRPVYAAATRVDRAQLDVAASLGARPARVIATVLLPELLPSIMAGASTCLLLTLNEFGIVLFFGAKTVLTLPVLIYSHGIVTGDYPPAAVLACVQVVLSLVLYLLGRLVVRWLGGRGAGLD